MTASVAPRTAQRAVPTSLINASITITSITMKRFGLSAVLMLLAFVAPAEDWHVVRPNNRPYVSFADVAQFYQFPEYTRVSRTVSLRSERRTIRAQAGTSELSINGVRFWTHFPLLNNNDKDLT